MELSHNKIVSFTYCKFCEHKNKSEDDEPCFECLENPVNIDSHRPVCFKDNGSLARVMKNIEKITNKE